MFQMPIVDLLERGRGLSDHQHASAVESIRDGATERANQKPRHGVKKSYYADGDRRARDVPHQPTLRDVLHEIA